MPRGLAPGWRHRGAWELAGDEGEEWARERLSQDLGRPLAPCRAMPDFAVPDHLGWHEQGDGKLYLGVPVPSGRIVDDGRMQARSVLREIVGRFVMSFATDPGEVDRLIAAISG